MHEKEKNPYVNSLKIELAKREMARRNLLHFTKYTMEEFESTRFHETYYTILNMFAHQMIKKLMVTIPPQYGKSEGSSRRLPAFMLGNDAHKRIAILSYAASFAEGFSRDNQRIMDSNKYKALFPETILPTLGDKGYIRNTTKFEIVGKRGSLKTVGRGGPLTGDPVDIAIMDDLYKDSEEGNSPIIRNKVIDWYNSVVIKRLHRRSQQLIVFTRWHEGDLIGWLEENSTVIEINNWDQLKPENINNRFWYKINFPALMNHKPTEIDPREMDEPLYPERHTKEDAEEQRALDPEMFESMNQGDPTPKAGLLYSMGFKTYIIPPANIKKRGNYTDTADKGVDYLCSINYVVSMDDYVYVTDLVYTQAPQEETEPLVAALLKRGQVRVATVESNNGGRAFGRTIARLLKNRIIIKEFYQNENKESRILTHATECQRKILFPENWDRKYPEFYKSITRFKRKFKANLHDDACFPAGTKISTIAGLKNIEDITTRDRVITPFGIRKVLASAQTGVRAIIENRGIIATSDHNIYTNKGFLPLDRLTGVLETDTLNLRRLILWRYKKLLFLMESNIDSWDREIIILVSQQQIREEKVLKDFMWQFGNFITRGKFLKGIVFITKIIILITMTFLTWSVYQLRNITNYTQSKIKKLSNYVWKKLGLKLLNGIGVKKVGNGIAYIVKKLWKIVKFVSLPVKNVERVLKQFILGHTTVQTCVEIGIEENMEPTNISMKKPVLFVESPSKLSIKRSPKNLQIPVVPLVEVRKAIEIGSKVPVYNITVEIDHVYYANNTLVSNCDCITGIIEHSGVFTRNTDSLYRK